jgi:hypothetical protein
VRDLYKVLGIAPTADNGRIKTAFRRRAKAFHPDLNPGDSRAEERFRELAEAYEVLRSAHARATYDAYRAQRRSAVRRRVAGSAAMMAASFALTLGSAFAVLAAHDTGSPLREGWKVVVTRVASAFVRPAEADEWTKATSVTVARMPEMEIAKAPPATAVAQPGKVPRRRVQDEQAGVEPVMTTAAPHGKAEAPVRVVTAKKFAAASRPSPDVERNEAALQSMVAIGDVSRTWPIEDEPRMGLGAARR